jgi:hypothetical protein
VFVALLLQIVTLVPPSLAEGVTPDSDYTQAVVQLAATDSWSADQMAPLACEGPAQQSALVQLVLDGNDGEVRLAAVLGSGVASDSLLGRAFWKRAALDFNEARCLASLLAPAAPSADALPLLAWIATDKRRTLPVRAAAVARLLDADCLAAWPMARLMLLTGTAADETTAVANWPRRGRYELPKRILLLALQDLLERHQQPATDFEPNGPWQLQVEQVDSLSTTIAKCSPPPATDEKEAPGSWQALQKFDKAGSEHAAASFELFRHRATEFLND